MKLWIISDLHLEMAGSLFDDHFTPSIPNADIAVVAGDVLPGCGNAIRWLDKMVAPAMPVVMVAGNHEFYGHSVFEGLEWARVHARECPDVHFLENDVAVIGGVRFVGCTMWTDFSLDGDVAWAAANFEGRMNDARAIAWRMLPAREGFGATRVLEMHARSRDFLRRSLQESVDGPTVVVTHHAPHRGSVHPKYKGSSLNPSFACDMSELMEIYRPELWVHGHVHDSFDYRVRDTRVICNPKGYANENFAFDPGLVVEV